MREYLDTLKLNTLKTLFDKISLRKINFWAMEEQNIVALRPPNIAKTPVKRILKANKNNRVKIPIITVKTHQKQKHNKHKKTPEPIIERL